MPTYIPSQNANITWTSSDESIITSTGRITAERLENASVTLFAEIKVNDTVITRKYTFKVSAHNNEINFYKLVQEISPIVINTVRNSQADDPDALYYLPIVNETAGVLGTYDYRTSFKCPTNSQLFDWVAYRNIGLENITYSMSQEQQTNFDYITLTNTNQLYLNNITLNNYANITITGDFGNSETYSTNINISITVGSNTQLLEKAFTQVSEEISQISILGNILSTRISNGMHNEKGDFELSHQFIDIETGEVNQDYTIEYSGEADIISSIIYNSTTEKYEFAINPEYFNEYETTVAFTATVYYRKGDSSGETSKSRTFYVTVPAALHAKDFGTVSIYNTTKYQVFNQLPANEKTSTTGYTLSGSTLTDTNLDYILLRDIVGDANYLLQYNNNDTTYLDKISYTSSNYCVGTETLSYQTASSNPTSTTDTQAYDFVRLIEWATGNTRVAASSVVSNTSALGSLGSTKANAEDYLNNEEIAVLKQYYQSCTSATDAEWNSLFSEVFNVAPGYIYTNPALLNTVIAALGNNNISFRSSTTDYSSLFGKYMEILQRYAVSTTKVNAKDVAPCQEQYNSTYTWYHSETNVNSFSLLNSNGTTYTISVTDRYQVADETYWLRGGWPSGANQGSGGDGNYAGFYAIAAFAADRTSYITEAERQVIMMFWLNVTGDNLTTAITNANKTKITNVLNTYSNYYSKYNITHFNDVVHAIINAFDACMEIPTYFATDGVAKIIKSFYDKKNYDLPTYDGTTSTLPFVSSVNGNIPYVTNADNIKSVLSYFVKLKTLSFIGNANLAVFLSENGLATVFARTGLYNNAIETLTMKHVAHTSVNFDLTNIKYFTSLKVLDLSNNSGIQSVNELVNVNRSNYTSVNIENIGIDYEYQEFAIDNIATPTCTVRYTNALGTSTTSNDNSRASLLANLSDFNKFITKYMYTTNVVYDDSGNKTTVTWRIDEGNEINTNRISKAGSYNNLNTVSEMNEFISPYYYCDESFTYNYGSFSYDFVADHIYKFGYSSNNLQITDLGASSKITTTSPIVSDQYLDVANYSPSVSTISSNEIISSGTDTIMDSMTWYTENDTPVTVTLSAQYVWKSCNAKRYISYDCFDGIPEVTMTEMPTGYNGANAAKVRMYFLLYSEVDSILNKKYKADTTITRDPALNTDYYLCFVYNNQLYIVGSTLDTIGDDNSVSVTTNLAEGLKFQIVQSTASGYTNYYFIQLSNQPSFRLRRRDSNYIVYHSKTDAKATFDKPNAGTSSSVSFAYRPSVIAEYTDGSRITHQAYSAGYDVVKLEGAVIKHTDLKRISPDSRDTSYVYYLYTGTSTTINDITLNPNTVIAAKSTYNYLADEIKREYTRSNSTIYLVKVWYYETNSSTKVYVSNSINIVKVSIDTITSTSEYTISSIRNNYPGDSFGSMSSYSYIYNNVTYTTEDVNYLAMQELYTNFVSRWEYSSTTASHYASYVADISSTSYDRLKKQAEFYYGIASGFEYVFRYNNSSNGSEDIYKWSLNSTSTSYTKNYGYKLQVSSGVLAWQSQNKTVSNDTGTTMDSILNTANQHFSDYHYGEYYGKYYGYNGTYSRYISCGVYIRPNYVYRIMPNESNTAFTWVEVGPYTTASSNDILQSLGTGGLNVGDICYSTATSAFGYFYGSVWYKVVLDEKTNIVNLVRFNDVGFTTNGEQTYTQLTNDKLVPKTGDYLGYSGTFTIKISAMIRVYNSSTGTWTEYIKTYKLKFVGSLTS